MNFTLEKKDKIILLSTIVVVGFFIGVVFHYILCYYLAYPYPLATFLHNPKIVFGDFVDLIPKLKGFAPYTSPAGWQQYFPLSYLVLTPFAYIKDVMVAYYIYISIFLGFWGWFNWKKLSCSCFGRIQNFQQVFILTFLSYPFLFSLDRGNFDIIVLMFFTAFVYMLKDKKYFKAALILGVINAFKPFCLAFLLLFLFDKKYKEFFYSVALSAFLVIGGFLLFKGDFLTQVLVWYKSVLTFKDVYFLDSHGGQLSCSNLFMALKTLFCLDNNLYSPFKFTTADKIYFYYGFINFFVSVTTLIFTFREKVFWKRIALLTLLINVMPAASFDYKLIFLFVPLWLFVNSEQKSKFDIFYTVLFGLMLIPKKFIFVSLTPPILIPFSVLTNPVIMLFFIALIIFDQYFKKEAIEHE